MAKYNTKKISKVSSTKTDNLAGGEAFKLSTELELITLLATSFNKDEFYRTQKDMASKLANTIHNYPNKEFIAKLAVYIRNEFGMRSITHFVAAVIAKEVKGEKWTKNFFSLVFRRVDDITETVACYLELYGKPVPNSLKKGIRLAFNKFDGFQLARYRAEDSSVKLIDIVNLVHPTPTKQNAEALSQLVAEKLKQANTFESEIGKDNKEEAWTKLIEEDKLGYFALLRNLRNIEKHAPKVLPRALLKLVNRDEIKSSLVLPFRYFTAYKELRGSSSKIRTAISQAAEISLDNVPKFDGETLVVLDQSGSMAGDTIEIGALFCACLAKANNADVITFGTSGTYENLNTQDSVLTIAEKLNNAHQGGTDFKKPFELANKAYNRIIILSDMQGWIGYDSPVAAFNTYKKKYKCQPLIYSFDLRGYGTVQFPQDKVFCLAGFSDKVFNLMKMLEKDKNAIIKTINEVSF